jgi:pimeloyl-ACP methyl ester carboxylesterase
LLSPYPVIYSWFYELNAVPADTAKYRELLAALRPDISADQAPEYCRRQWPIFFSPLRPDVGTPYESLASPICDFPADRIVTSQRTTRAVQRSLGQWVFRPELHLIEVPALVIEGGGSPLVEEAATRWAQHVPNARVLLLPRPYLFPWVGDPKAFREATTAFLSGEWPLKSVQPDHWVPPS